MTGKEKYTLRALLNKKKIWKKFNRLSIKTKKKDKKEEFQSETDLKRIETKRFFDTKKSKNSKIMRFLRSSFSQTKFETSTSQFIFEFQSTTIKRTETKKFLNVKKFKNSKIIESLNSFFSSRRSEIFTFTSAFDSRNTRKKRIETSDVELFFSLTLNTSKSSKDKKVENNSENTSITEKKTSATQNVISIETIESILSIQSKFKVLQRKSKMKNSSIKLFWDKKDDRKNSNEYLKNIEFIYQIDYKSQKTIKNDKNKYKNNVHRILFRQNLRKEAKDWYSNLSKTIKSDWTTLRIVFKTQFEVEIDVEANKYLLLQRVITLIQRSNEDITNYFRRTKNLTRHLLSAVEIIEYNVVKKMKNKLQRERINFECNKNRDFSLKKIKLIIQTTYQTMNTMNSFDLEWNHLSESFNLDKDKEKILFIDEWN
jgi:hypothetical protein